MLQGFSAEETTLFMARRQKPANINDMLIAGMLLTIHRWNLARRSGEGRISTMMPVNVRPKPWWFEVIDMLDIPTALPSVLKSKLKEITPTLGRNLVESTWVSNIGRLGEAPSMGDAGKVSALYFSPPAPLPMGVSLGNASMEDRMFLSYRYRRAVLDGLAAQEFASLCKSSLLGDSD